MKNSQQNISIPVGKDVIKISQDAINQDPVYGGNTHKIDPSDTTAFSYHVVDSVANNTSKDIIVPFSINSVSCQAYTTNRTSTGSMWTGSQGCHYLDNTGLAPSVWVDATRMINLWVWTVTCTINGRILTIANSAVWSTITVILTFFA